MKKGLIAIFTALMLILACASLSACTGEDVEGGVIYNGVWAIGCEGGATEITIREGTIGIKSGAFKRPCFPWREILGPGHRPR